ncbi:MAG TPA: mechanosensitive ion channel family protein [Vicinamibacterales bacterium]|nr:mechanosensitive ion channel family protein [Vicinamibacterales bacterium]
MPLSLIAGFALLLASLGFRRATINRHIRGRLLLSASLFALYTLAGSGLHWLSLPDDTRQMLQAINPLLFAFAAINFIVTLSVNPWRLDRVPERFPNIVQDTLVIALFALVATLILRDRVMATTAVGAVVIGLALQDTLGNLFAGLAIQIEKPFRVGDWVTIGGQDGMVSEITWRATKMRTKAGNFVVVPNSVLAKDTITNYCEPSRSLRLQVEVGASYDVAPNVVKSVIRDALESAPALLHERPPEVLLVDFGNSSIVYRVRFWVSDFEGDERAKDLVRSLIYYAFKRNNIAIPYPIQVEMSPEEGGLASGRTTLGPDVLAPVSLFSTLTEAERTELVAIARPVLYAGGEAIVRQGQAGRSMFVVLRGQASVTLSGTDGEVARLKEGHVFGEMSLLTGEARNATVTAIGDCDLLEIDADNFRRLVLANPSVLERVMAVTSTRKEELDRHREAHAIAPAPEEARQSLLARVRQFLRL